MKRESENRRVLVACHGDAPTFQPVGRVTEGLLCRGFPVRVCTQESAGEHARSTPPFSGRMLSEPDDADSLLQGIGHVVLAASPLWLLAKTAALDDSDSLARLLLHALCAGIPVTALAEGVDPRFMHGTPQQQEGRCPSRLFALLSQKLRAAADMGIAVVPLADFFLRLDTASGRRAPVSLQSGGQTPHPRRVITAEDVAAAAAAGRLLAPSENDILTPMARDLLNEQAKKVSNPIQEGGSSNETWHRDRADYFYTEG